jgi:hypothetical protein
MRHYNSLNKALKAGQPWDIATGKLVPSGMRPRSPFDAPAQLGNSGWLGHEALDDVRKHVEVDAARVLPHVMAWCVAEMLSHSGLAENPEALRAFAESTAHPATPIQLAGPWAKFGPTKGLAVDVPRP